MPAGWTLFSNAYPSSSLQQVAPSDWTIHPYLDNPPLMSLLAGAIVWLRGDRTFAEVVHDPTPRLLAIAMTTVTIPLLYLVGRRVLGEGPALVGSALYALSPAAVLFGRVVAAEEVIALCLLAALWAVLELQDGGRRRLALAILFAACLVAPTAKAPGLIVAGSAVLCLSRDRLWLGAATAVVGASIGTALVLLYAAAFDWHAFMRTVEMRGEHLTLLTPYSFITSRAGIGRHAMVDGWWLVGWIGLARRSERSGMVALAPLLYALALLGMAADYSATYGWYRLAVMPLVYLGAGDLAWRAIVQPEWSRFAFLALAAIATAASWSGHVTPAVALIVGLGALAPTAAYAIGARYAKLTAALGALALLISLLTLDLRLETIWS